MENLPEDGGIAAVEPIEIALEHCDHRGKLRIVH
jgi:hypothetical protein